MPWPSLGKWDEHQGNKKKQHQGSAWKNGISGRKIKINEISLAWRGASGGEWNKYWNDINPEELQCYKEGLKVKKVKFWLSSHRSFLVQISISKVVLRGNGEGYIMHDIYNQTKQKLHSPSFTDKWPTNPPLHPMDPMLCMSSHIPQEAQHGVGTFYFEPQPSQTWALSDAGLWLEWFELELQSEPVLKLNIPWLNSLIPSQGLRGGQ